MLVLEGRASGSSPSRRGLVLHLEGVAATARRGRVRVVDRKSALEAVDEVDLRPAQVRSAERIDHDLDAVRVELEIAGLGGLVEAERVLEARAAAALHRDAEHAGLGLALLGHQRLDLR